MHQRNRGKNILVITLLLVVLALFIFIISLILRSPERQAKAVVEEFYLYEQEGIFTKSWELFHPYMQEKFPKGNYLQDRAHVFMNHFGVSTFDFSIGDIEKVEDWTMEEGRESIDTAYKVTIYQGYDGKYGYFTIVQDVYATIHEGKWQVLWDYSS